jgi:hypothetical protein
VDEGEQARADDLALDNGYANGFIASGAD